MQDPEASGVAIKKVAFGEGGERLAFQFFEVANDGVTVVGEPLVAKLSRFIEEEHEMPNMEAEVDELGRRSKWAARDNFVKKFCERQHKALLIAEEFNVKLGSIKRLDPDTPRVTFLECSVYYVNNEKVGESALLVERKLNGKFVKWNGNNGVSWLKETMFGSCNLIDCSCLLTYAMLIDSFVHMHNHSMFARVILPHPNQRNDVEQQCCPFQKTTTLKSSM